MIRRRQRLSAYGLLTRPGAGDAASELLLTRISSTGHHPGAWTLPGGGVEHGEDPRAALVREMAEETGLVVRAGRLLDVHSSHFTGRAPDGVLEDFHGVHLLFDASPADPAAAPVVTEAGGTTDAVAWVELPRLRAGHVEVLEVVEFAVRLLGQLPSVR